MAELADRSISRSTICSPWPKHCNCCALPSCGAQLVLTPSARRYAQAEVDARKGMFGEALLAHVPLAQHIRRILDERASHKAPARRFRDELEDHMSEDFAEETLKTVTNWGRYAEIFTYHEHDDLFSLDDPT
jgi:NitT/TauT family transport system ATP-binding protein